MSHANAVRCLKTTLFLVGLILAAPQYAPAQATADRFSVDIGTPTVQSLDNSAAAFRASGTGYEVRFALPTGSGPVTARLIPHDIRSSGYRAEVSHDSGTLADPVNIELFKEPADVNSAEEFYRFARIRQPDGTSRLFGFFRDKKAYYQVESRGPSSSLAVVMLSPAEFNDIVLRWYEPPQDAVQGYVLPQALPAAVTVAELATEADYEFYSARPDANARILATLNAVDAIYESELNISLTVTYQHAWNTSSDPYTTSDPSSLLDQFGSYWNANYASRGYDLAHLWTGRDLNGGVAGIAWLDAACSPFRYGLSQYLGSSSLDVPLAAHEMGHNLGADHDVCSSSTRWIMCPSLVSNANQFSSVSKAAIGGFVASAGCLSSGGGDTPQPPPDDPQGSPPVLAPIGAKTVPEGNTLSFTLSATDPDGGTLTFSASSPPSGAVLSGTSFTYSPPQGTVPAGQASTAFSVVFTVADSTGLTDSETVQITVNAVNSAPQLVDAGPAQATEGALFNYQFAALDADGDALAFGAVGLPAGAVLDAASGVFSWKPAGNQAGNYSIEINVRDPYGASDSAYFTLSVSDAAGVAPLPSRHVPGSFTAGGSADAAVFRPADGMWYYQPISGASSMSSRQFGLPGDIPVPADYDGDRLTDTAVFRPAANVWYILHSNTGAVTSAAYGLSGDIPAPADYDGDGRSDLAVYRPALGLLIYRPSYNPVDSLLVALGAPGDIPAPCDYDGDGRAEPAVFRPQDGSWQIMFAAGLQTRSLGVRADIPVAADFNGDGSCEPAVWRPSEGNWYIEGRSEPIQFGLGEDVPVPADFNGDGAADPAVWRPSLGMWFVRGNDGSASALQLGLPSDLVSLREMYYFAARLTNGPGTQARGGSYDSVYVYRSSSQQLYQFDLHSLSQAALPTWSGSHILRADYDGDGVKDAAVFTGGVWGVYGSSTGLRSYLWGTPDDQPVAGDFDADGKADLAVFRPDAGGGFSQWFVIRSSDGAGVAYGWGLYGDQPIPGDYNGDGWTDLAVWRPSMGFWFVLDARSGMLLQAVQWGLPGDIIRAADYDADGRADKIVWRPANGTWYVLQSGGSAAAVQWGLPGDVPVPGAYFSAAIDFAVYRPSSATLFARSISGQAQSFSPGLAATDVVAGVQPSAPVR